MAPLKPIQTAAALLGVGALLPGFAPALGDEITVGGLAREYHVFTPPSAQRPAPTVIVLHGGGGNSRQVRRHTEFDDLARRVGAVAVYPQGVDGHWNDGRVNGPEANFSSEDDVGFLRALIARLVADGVADRDRIFMTGISNGGFMTLRFACAAPDLIAGAAVVAANQPAPAPCEPFETTPIIFFHGTEDEWVPWEGGEVAVQARGYRGETWSVPDTLALWSRINGCARRGRDARVAEPTRRDPTRVRVRGYEGCIAPLSHVIVDGGGHTWPGAKTRRLMTRIVGPTTRGVDANEMMWRFWTTGSALD